MRRTRSLATTVVAAVVFTLISSGPAASAAPIWCDTGSKIYILGDSSATGYGSTGYDPSLGRHYQPTTWGWSRRLDGKLTKTSVTNLALNGATASDFLVGGGVNPWPVLDTGEQGPLQPTAVSRIKTAKPDLVIIALGGNEYASQRHPYSTYKKNLVTLRDRVLTASPRSKLLFVRMWDFSFRYAEPHMWAADPFTYPWAEYAKHTKIVAARHSYLDLTLTMPKSDDGADGLYIKDEMGPGLALHATDDGHKRQYTAYWNKVKC